MPDSSTTRLGLTKPEDGGSNGNWGPKLNTNFDVLDNHPGIIVVADSAELAALTGNWEGRVVYQADNNKLYKYDGLSMIEVGKVDTILTAKGDLLVFGEGLGRFAVGENNKVLQANSAVPAGLKWVQNTRGIAFYIDGILKTELKASFVSPCALTMTEVKIAVSIAPTGADLITDIHVNGTTAFSTQANRPTISIGAKSATSPAPDVASIAAGDLITLLIDQIGSAVAGSDLSATIICEVV